MKLSRQEKKKLVKDELISKKIEKKLITRAHNDGVSSNKPSDICITLGKMAYDLSRSGTPGHLEDLTASLPFLIPVRLPAQHINPSLEARGKQARLFAESAYLLALSGVSLATSLHTTGIDCPEVTTVLDLLVHHASASLTATVPHSASTTSTTTTTSSKSTLDSVSKDIMQMLEYFAVAGLGISPPHDSSTTVLGFHHLAQAITLALPPNTGETGSSTSAGVALAGFLSGQTSPAGGDNAGLNPQGLWLHSPCGAPLTALWNHR